MTEIEKQVVRLYEYWLRYTLNDDRTVRVLNGLFELIPDNIRSEVFDRVYNQ